MGGQPYLIFSTKNLLGPETFLDHFILIFDQTIFFLSKDWFHRIFLLTKCFWTENFFDQNFFGLRIFFDIEIYWTEIFFLCQKIFILKIFLTNFFHQNLKKKKFFCDINFYVK